MSALLDKALHRVSDALPQDVRTAAARVHRLWRAETNHPSLRFKRVNERHEVYSIRIGIHWRALGYRGRDETGQATIT